MVERLVRNEKVRGSNPLTSTNFASAKFIELSGDENLFDRWGALRARVQSEALKLEPKR